MSLRRVQLWWLLFLVVACVHFTLAQEEKRGIASESLSITTKPRPCFTDTARKKHLQGSVLLTVTFQADGQIGDIIDSTKKKRDKFKKYGLTGCAIAAAKKIGFVPAKENGLPITITKRVEYIFSIY